MRLSIGAIELVSVALVATLAAAAPSKVAGQDLDEAAAACLGCHAANPDRRGSGIDADRFVASVHASLGCRMCHSAGYDGFPHTASEEQKAGDCTTCHTGSGEPYHFGWIYHEVRASVHGRLVSEEFACTECHDPHEYLPVHRAPDLRTAIENANRQCLTCHGLEDEAAENDEPHSIAHLVEVHSFLPRLRSHARSARCVECHTPSREQTVHLILSARSAVRECVECHTADSALLDKLYRHMAKEDRRAGFINSVILNDYYVVGATQNKKLDNVMWGLFGLSLLGVCVHGAIRVLTRSGRS
jgi:nitrate reductase cytochrome c-type subunit